MELILFLGAGVSVPSGLPTAAALTDRLLHHPYYQDDRGNFRAGPGADSQDREGGVTQRIREFLGLLHTHDMSDIQRVGLSRRGDGFISSGAVYRSVSTYEDLYFLCQQISLWNCGLSDNSLTTPFMESIERKAQGLFRGQSLEARLCDLATLGEQAASYIESVVADSLRREYVTGFDLIGELVAAEVQKLHIVTLNHDTLVEQYLSANQIAYTDGFGEPDGEVRWSDDSVYDDTPGTRVRILKLHGSVNWYSYLHEGRARAAIPRNADPETPKDIFGNALIPWSRKPSFLSGINKTVHYQRGIFSDMRFRFSQALRRCERMIICGFGWSDSAIAFQIDTWLDRRRTNRVILLHENPVELIERSLIMASGHDGWVRAGQLVPITRWLVDTALNDIEQHLR